MTTNKKKKPEPGNVAEDGTIYDVGQFTKEGIYIGRFKDKNGAEQDYFAASTDAQDRSGERLFLNFNGAAKYTKNLNDLGHNDWVVPTGWKDDNGAPDILGALFNSKSKGAFKGTFDETNSYPDGWYWSSSSRDGLYARIQRFSNGSQVSGPLSNFLLVRPVRSVPVAPKDADIASLTPEKSSQQRVNNNGDTVASKQEQLKKLAQKHNLK